MKINEELLNKSIASIPYFKNTEHALEYGRSCKGIWLATFALAEKRKRFERVIEFMGELGLVDEAIYLASGQNQFCREALEAAEGREPKMPEGIKL